MGDIPSLAGSEQPRLVKVGKGHYNETWPEVFGFNLLEGDLKPITVLWFVWRGFWSVPLFTSVARNDRCFPLFINE